MCKLSRMRQASGDLFPSDSPIPASQMIGRRDDVREVATRLEAGTHLIVAGAAPDRQDQRVRGGAHARAPARRLRGRGRPVPGLRRGRAGRGGRGGRDLQPLRRHTGCCDGRAAPGAPRCRRLKRGRSCGWWASWGRASSSRSRPGWPRRTPSGRSTWRSSCRSAWRRRRPPPDDAVLRRVPGGRLGAPSLRRPRRRDQPDARHLPAQRPS